MGGVGRVASWFCIYYKLPGHVEATVPQICSTLLTLVFPVRAPENPTGPLSLVSFLALVNSFQLIAKDSPYTLYKTESL